MQTAPHQSPNLSNHIYMKKHSKLDYIPENLPDALGIEEETTDGCNVLAVEAEA